MVWTSTRLGIRGVGTEIEGGVTPGVNSEVRRCLSSDVSQAVNCALTPRLTMGYTGRLSSALISTVSLRLNCVFKVSFSSIVTREFRTGENLRVNAEVRCAMSGEVRSGETSRVPMEVL